MTYACPTWEAAADKHIMKQQLLQNKILWLIGGLSRRKSTHYIHLALQIPYVYDFITKTCRKQAEVTQNHDNENVRSIGNGEAQKQKYKGMKLGDDQA
jgi:hypothetical protein